MPKKSNRPIFQCKKCSKPKDLVDGRLMALVSPRTGLGYIRLYEEYAWICFDCLPLNAEEELEEI